MTTDLLQRAKDFDCIGHYAASWHDRVEVECDSGCLHHFAQSERTRIADEIEALSQKTPIDAMVTALLAYADKLRKND